MKSRVPLVGALSLVLLTSGCASFQAVNEPIATTDPFGGYRPSVRNKNRDRGDVALSLAFSGGGTRAAAFAYGVMEELRDTQVSFNGEDRRLLDEVDTISGVSGGSFPAAYYGLFGDRIFSEFEERFLRRNIQSSLVRLILSPINLVRLLSPNQSRTTLAASHYHKNVFEESTFADLEAADGPTIFINATDVSQGYRFTFIQSYFDLICSDLSVLPISYAVAASSAVPMVLAPLTLRNNAGSCGLEKPDWLEEALKTRKTDPRRYRIAEEIEGYMSPEKRFIHLVDGGISDNLGLRVAIDNVAIAGDARRLAEVTNIKAPDHMIVIAVNAERDSDSSIDVSETAPGIAGLMNAVSGSQIRRYNFETIELMRDTIVEAAEELSTEEKTVTPHFILVDFEDFEDPEERDYYRGMATSFSLSDKEIDDLRGAGRRLLRQSPVYQQLLETLGAPPPGQ